MRLSILSSASSSLSSSTQHTSKVSVQAQAGQGMPGPGPGPGQAPARRPHDPRMRGADPRQQAQPRPVQPMQQPQAQPQQNAAANLPAEQQKGIVLLLMHSLICETVWFGGPTCVLDCLQSMVDGLQTGFTMQLNQHCMLLSIGSKHWREKNKYQHIPQNGVATVL